MGADMTRRTMLGAVAAAAATSRVAAAKTPVDIKIGLYSITYLAQWYRGDALTLEQVIDRAVQFGFEGVEIDGKRPHGNPLDMPAKRCRELAKIAAGKGVPIYAVAGNNDFSSPIPEAREAQLVYVHDLIRMTADLNAKVLRLFMAWPGVTKEPMPNGGGRYDVAQPNWEELHKQFPSELNWELVRNGLKEAARWAGDAGVTLALQNHHPVVTDYPDVLKMIKEVGSPHLQVALDVPLMKHQDDASIRKAAQDVGKLQKLTHFGGEFAEASDGSVKDAERLTQFSWLHLYYYKPFIRAMAEIGYNGYIGYELCHPLPVIDGQTVGVEFADKNAKLAAKFMRNIINEVRKELA